jgi:hypothetical protein
VKNLLLSKFLQEFGEVQDASERIMQLSRSLAGTIPWYLTLRAPRTQAMRHFRRVVTLIILAGAISLMFAQSPAQGIKNVFWQPNELQQGSVAFITIELDRVPLRVTGKWIGKDIAFFKSDNPKIW